MQCAFLLKRSLPCQKDNSYRIDKPIFLFQCCTIIQKNIQHDSSTKCIKKEQEITTFSTLIQSLKNNTNRTVLIRVKNSNLNILQKNPTNPIHPSISLSKTFRKKKGKKHSRPTNINNPSSPFPFETKKKERKKLPSTRLDSTREQREATVGREGDLRNLFHLDKALSSKPWPKEHGSFKPPGGQPRFITFRPPLAFLAKVEGGRIANIGEKKSLLPLLWRESGVMVVENAWNDGGSCARAVQAKITRICA